VRTSRTAFSERSSRTRLLVSLRFTGVLGSQTRLVPATSALPGRRHRAQFLRDQMARGRMSHLVPMAKSHRHVLEAVQKDVMLLGVAL